MYLLNAGLLVGAASIALAALAAPGAASAASTFGSGAILTNRPCLADATSCFGRQDFTQYAGGMGAGFSTSASIPGGASAAGAVSFGPGYLPTIKAASSAGAQTRTGGNVVAFRSFTYEGEAAIDLAFQGTLHYFTSGDFGPGELAGEGLLYAQISVLPISAIAGYSALTTGADIIHATSVNEIDCSTGAMAFSSVSGASASGEHTVKLGITQGCDGQPLTLSKGDTFVLLALLQSISNRGGFIDAMNTFTVQYDEVNTVYTGTTQRVGLATLQQTVTSTVPEPGTWALMICGFGLAGSALRRQRLVIA